MDSKRTFMTLMALGLVALGIGLTVFTVDERQLAIRLRFGEIVQWDYQPGVHFKWPDPINSVRVFERRILTINKRESRFLTSDKVNLLVDFFVKWRITDAREFYTAARGSERIAADRLTEILNDGLRREFAARTVQ